MDITKSHLVICTRVVDLGTQIIPARAGKAERKSRQLWLEFEFVNLLKEGTQYRLNMGRKFDYYMKEGSWLRTFVEGWRGRKYASDEKAAEMKPKNLLGFIGLATMSTYTGKNGIGYQIDSIAPAIDIEKPEAKSKQIYFWFDGQLDHTALTALPEFLRKQICASAEYKSIMGVSDEPKQMTVKGSQAPVFEGIDDDGSDLPF